MADENTTVEQVQENSTQQDTTSGTTEKTFTQAELDKIVADRVSREKAKLPSKDELAEFRRWRDEHKTAEEKSAEAVKTAQEAQTAAERKAAELEAKYTAISKGVKAENVDDVIALAMGRVTDTVTLEQAIDSVIKKYPSFSSSAITTGVPSGGGTSKISGVEAAFLARNPGLKI